MKSDRNGLEVLDRAQCLQLLRQSTVGRVGVSVQALPAVLPVDFWLDEDRVLIRTCAGSTLDAALRDAVVAFEVDEVDRTHHSGWSVMIRGMARQVHDVAGIREPEPTPLARWGESGGQHLIEIPTDMVTGRRLWPRT